MSTPTNEQVYQSKARRIEGGEIQVRPSPVWIEGLDEKGEPLSDAERREISAIATAAARKALQKYLRK